MVSRIRQTQGRVAVRLLSFLVLIQSGAKVITLSRYLVLCCGLRYELHNRGLSVPSGSHGYRPAIRCQPAG